jgi:tetratricopeptide (TPR) repeat protein
MVLVTFLLLLLFGQITHAQEATTTLESNIAYGYYQQAESLFLAGRFESAARLLDISLEFFPSFSESAFLYAKLYLRQQETTSQAINSLQDAISSNTWVDTDPLIPRIELARVFVRTTRFRQARQIIAGLEENVLGGRGNPDLTSLWAQTLIGTGELGSAENFLRDAVRRFPQSSNLYTLLAQVFNRRGNRAGAKNLLGRGIREMPRDAELLYQLAALEADSEIRTELVDRYLRVGGTDPGAALLAIIGGAEDSERFIEEFFRLGGNGRVGYIETLLEYGGRTEAGVARMLDGYTGTRILDANRDGYYEQLYRYEAGQLRSWISDQDQDGIPEATIRFDGDDPRALLLGSGENLPHMEYRYSDYPYLEEVAFVSGSTRREYRIIPYQLDRPALASPTRRAFSFELRSDVAATEEYFRKNSYRMEEYSEDTMTPDRVYHYLSGRITRIDDNPDPKGNFTHTVHYVGLLPAEGYRDLDGDGIPEIREEFAEGSLRRITLDKNGDGVNEFEQVFEPGSTRMYWDYNDDGLFDSREYVRTDGEMVREFSSRLNGTYDLTFVGETRCTDSSSC